MYRAICCSAGGFCLFKKNVLKYSYSLTTLTTDTNTMAKQILYYAVAVVMLIAITACSDNSSGTEEAEPPAIPNLEYAQPDVSYFTGFDFLAATDKTNILSESTSFAEAQNIILSFSSFSTFGQGYTDFIRNSDDATFNDGVWEWRYEFSFQGITSSIRLTAEEEGPVINWEVFNTLEGAGLEPEELNVMSGFTRNDGLQGEWTFNSLFGDSETPFMVSEWTAESETERQLNTVIYDEFSGNTEEIYAEIDFSQSGSEYLMNTEFADNTEFPDTEIFWNTASDIGYIIQNGEKRCWQGRGQNATNISCSEVGL